MAVFAELINTIESLSSDEPSTEDQWHSLLNATMSVPKPESLSALYNSIAALESTTPKVRLIAILACLKSKQKLEGDRATAEKLADWAATAIAPCSRPAATDRGDQDEDGLSGAEDYEDTVQRVRETAAYGLEILRICAEDYPARFRQDTLLTLISFTDTHHPASTDAQHPSKPPPPLTASIGTEPPHPWTTPETSQLAGQVLATQAQRAAPDALVTTVLQAYLRPLFSKSRPGGVTASGRKAEFPPEQDVARGLRDETGEVKPWKYVDHRAIAVFGWAVREANEELISKQWHMFIPVLLTLLDDGTTRVRRAGLLLLPTFLGKFPNNILHSTGLASVFEDAVFPTLHLLPSITPEAESVQLLAPAYQSLLVLSGKLEPQIKSGPNASRTPRARLLDRVLRDGVFSGYSHAKEHARVVWLLFSVTRRLVQEMGIHAVKHLKDLIPMHCEFLTDPFAVAAPKILEHVLLSLGTIIWCCWPRLDQPPYQDEIIKALVICFLNIQDDSEADGKLQGSKDMLLHLGQTFWAVGTQDSENTLKRKVAPLIAKEPALEILFRPAFL